jgi:hypothetical protein
MPRIETIKGWRFTFPPKVLNKSLKGKTVFIIDDGSCSGETILQMIDSICFYEVEKIIVLSVFGRLEDFQREFYSRIKKIKVKKLKGDNIDDSQEEPIIDTHIYFGTHLNIHHFPFEKSAPFIKEREKLEIYLNQRKNKIPRLTENYISRRIKELKVLNIKDIDKKYDSKNFHFPKNKQTKELDIVRIYTIRNILGKLESFRIYIEYYEAANFQEEKDLELIIGIINHEPRILDTIKSLIPELYLSLKKLIERIIFEEHLDLSKRSYLWEIESLIMFLSTG